MLVVQVFAGLERDEELTPAGRNVVRKPGKTEGQHPVRILAVVGHAENLKLAKVSRKVTISDCPYRYCREAPGPW